LRQTKEVRKFLIDYIVKNKIKTFLDAPCGGMVWQINMIHEIESTYLYNDLNYTGCGLLYYIILLITY
jgi:hypothetical protein